MKTTTTNTALVMGAAVIGLRTTLESIRRNVQVVSRSPVPPTHASVCSVGAGGL